MSLGGGLLVALLGGCPQTDNPGGTIPNLDQPNNFNFDNATALSLGKDDQLKFAGDIASASDVDVYKLGTINPGDRVFADVQTTSGDLDAVAAIFDKDENIHAFNDDRAEDASNLNPLIDFVCRGPTGDYFLAIAPLYGSRSTGAYQVTVRITREVGVPDPEPQIVYLNWRGGQNITIKNVGTFDLDPFDATDVGPYAGLTKSMKLRVQQIVAERYQGFALILLNSDSDAVPFAPHSTIYFGGSNAQAFAISEKVDSWNKDPNDDCIIFTGSFKAAFGSDPPTFEEICQSMGNTVAHEVGHLLGLVHTKSCNDLMDTTCGNSRILLPQTLTTAPLDTGTFPLGFQDSGELIGWVLGTLGL